MRRKFLVAGSLLAAVLYPTPSAPEDASRRLLIERNLAEVTKQMQPMLPMRIDEDSMLVALRSEGMNLIYSIKSVFPKDVLLQVPKPAIKEMLTKTACNRASMKKFFANDVRIHYVYVDEANVPIVVFVLTKADCRM